ncbi:MAG: endonuclease NucS [Bifidobacterium aquikefiri]|uniref:Endonuclease NucS n=1 Tax=Bifidobacterium aquikefiri TaxID=1653207 RepID=A0A261G9S5_9BIFI|nr:endonuclease NucS [Bifidobacterium aquikefiri]OZG67945.1 hypothetical protein BAQU_0590 [Bifidobacterium aquikefiri]
MRIIVADCSARYTGRLNASLDRAKRVLLIKADSSCLIFSELGSYKPLNWMTAPCTLHESVPQCSGNERAVNTGIVEAAEVDAADVTDDDALDNDCIPEKVITVCADKSDDVLAIDLWHIYSDQMHELGIDPGLVKDGVEDHLQHYLAEQIDRIGKGARLVRREYPTAIGPVDIMAIDAEGNHVAIEIKRHGGIDGVEQLTRYCTLLNRDPLLTPVRGIFAAQTITPQAKVLAEDRGFHCLILDYESMKHAESDTLTLF